MPNLVESSSAIFQEWIPEDYLRDYYQEVQPDEVATIGFLSNAFKKLYNTPKPLMLEFGAGPTFHHIFAAVPYVDEIHMGDYLDNNLAVLEKWLKGDASSHNWDPFIEFTLRCEGNDKPTARDVEKRKRETKSKVTRLIKLDASLPNPAGPELRAHYPLVMSCYCADSATTDKKEWEDYMENIMSMVKPHGAFITTALAETEGYNVGPRQFPSAQITGEDMRSVIALAFPSETTTIDVVRFSGGEHTTQGYHGVVLASATGKR